ncbi:MAG: PQQ-binding-like beta-propeller repeat protein [Pirellulaceae bacterium]
MNRFCKSLANSFKIFLTVVFIVAWAGSTTAQDLSPSEFRHWTTKDGKRSGVRLKLIERRAKGVQLEREDSGKKIIMPLASLSAEDREFLATTAEQPGATSSPTAASSDWPQWRGPNRDGKSPASGLLSQWPADGPKLLWNVTGLGEGYSTPAVVGDKIYLLGTKGNDAFVLALSGEDGQPIWDTRLGSKGGGGGFAGPKGTPTVDGDLIYALGGDGSLACVRRDDGRSVWAKNLKGDFGGKHGHWEYAESPLIDDAKLICTPGGSATIVALNKANGDPIWRSNVGQLAGDGFATAGYASPILADILGTRQYITFLHGGVVGVSANDGTPLWHYDAPANGTANCSTPVVQNNLVFAASAYGTGGGRATLKRTGKNWHVAEDYFVKKMENHHGGFVLHDGHIYGTNNSVLLCLDWNTGDIKWQDRCVGKGSVTMADGHLYVRGEGGDIALVEANSKAYREKGRFSQPDRSDKNAWAHPVVAGGRLYLHDQDRLFCYDLSE